MSRRLEGMMEQAIADGGHRAQKLASESGGFSEELKAKLENRIRDSEFRNENATAFAALSMPVCTEPLHPTFLVPDLHH